MPSDDPFGGPQNEPPIHTDPLIGALLDGRYRIVDTLGTGGVADVYRGETEGMRRKVAIKVLQEDFGANENLRGRFDREARALAAMSHPHIVHMIDYGVTEGMPYLVMELLEGQTLADRLDEEGTLPPERAFHITRQIVRALVFAHGQGLIHRDLKPANVFLQDLPGDPDHVKILDFGFAKFLEGDEEGPILTRTGMVFGTPPYMAPEQISGQNIDGRCDVYATAVMLFEMFADRRPFEGETQELLRSKLTETAPRLEEIATELEVRPELDALLTKALARDPSERFGTAAELGEALDAIPQPAVRRKGGWDSLVGDPSVAPVYPDDPAPPPAGPLPATGRTPLPRWAIGAGIAGVAALLLLLVCAGVATWLFLGYGEEGAETVQGPATGAAPGAPEERQSAEPARAAEPPALEPEGPAGVDPWAGELPEPLASARRKFRAGRQLSNAELRAVRAYARNHEDDPRPHLLSGHVYFARRWRSDALERYQLAYEVAPRRATGDPQMLANLIAMAAAPGRLGSQATSALDRMYGTDAISAVDTALRQPGVDDRQRERLQAVRSRLAN